MNYHPEYAPYHTSDETIIFQNQCNIHCSRVIYGDEIYINRKGIMTGLKKRNMERILGILCLENNKKYGVNSSGVPYYLCKPLRPEYENIYFYVTSTKKERRNMYVWIEFVDWKRTQKLPIGTIITYIGNIGERDVEYEMLRYYHKLQLPRWRIEKTQSLEDEINDIDIEIFSIDPIGSRDIDDAFHYRMIDENQFEIGVHIASPTRYFREEEWNHIIQHRISTIYLPNTKYNMIPDIYADDKCSLLENQKRYSMSIIYRYENFRCVHIEYKEMKVMCRKNYSYDEVDDGILRNTLDDIECKSLYEITNQMMCMDGENIENYDSHKMVEYWMIKTNHEVGKMCLEINRNKTIVRRCFESGVCNSNIRDENVIEYLQRRREMKSAEYVYYNENEDMGHHLLKLDIYTHFTSPIRRGIDFYIHLLMRGCIRDDYEVDIYKINSFIGRTRKLQRDMKRMEYIFNDKIENGERVFGVICNITSKYITVYIPKYNFEEKIWVTGRRGYEHTVEYGFERVQNEDTGVVTFYQNIMDIRVELEIGKEIEISLYKYKSEEHFRNKIRISL